MCFGHPSIPKVETPAPAAPAAQPAASIAQANAFNPANSSNAAVTAAQRGVASLTIPLMNSKPALGGVGPSGLGIPVS